MKFDIEVFNASSVKYLPSKKTGLIVEMVLLGEGEKNVVVNIIFVNDKKIKELNKEFLNHDFTTDVIAFSLSELNDDILFGEIYISIDTAVEQAKEYKVSLTNEILRLAVHGALHLTGYADNNHKERNLMHEMESKYLDKIKNKIT